MMNRNIITNALKIVEKCAMERKSRPLAFVMFNHILLPESLCRERKRERGEGGREINSATVACK